MGSSSASDPSPRESARTLMLVGSALLAVAIVGLLLAITLNGRPKPTPAATTTKPKTATQAPRVQLSLFASGLAKPTNIVANGVASDHNLYVLDQDGIINVVDKTGAVAKQPFLDIRSLVLSSGEMGLLGLAFSPHYATDGYFFVDYIDRGQNTILARYHVSNGTADPASAQTLLKVKQPYTNHKGGNIAFGPDGYLYVAFGDGGSAGDPQNRAQNLGVMFGKLLRLDVSTAPYTVPATNPFVNHTGTLPEIWDLGLRNPWRFSFDRTTGELYIGDVGQDKHEEVDVESAGNKGGNNYGWRCYEGMDSYNQTGGCVAKGTYTFPVIAYDHTDGRCSITGGYVYRGSKYSSLKGKYFYADYCGGQIYEMQRTSGQWQSTLAVQTPYKITTFGQDNSGELYLADQSAGTIYNVQTVAN